MDAEAGLLPPDERPFLERRFGLRDAVPDSDGTFGGLLLPREQHMFLWYTSWGALVSAVYATARNLWDLCPGAWLILLTSLLYWAHPKQGWRRFLDIASVQLVFWWQLYRAWGAQYAAPFYALSAAGVALYALTLFFEHRKKWFWASTLCHGGVHFFGNLANVVLYSGSVRPLAFSSPA